MKRILALALLCVMVGSLFGCGQTGTPKTTAPPTQRPQKEWTTTVEDEIALDNFIINTETTKLDEINRDRGANELIYYTPMRGETTKTNEYGMEVYVNAEGRVSVVGGNNMATQSEGFILSGNGRAARYISSYMPIGALITVDRDTYDLTITMDKQAYLSASLAALREVADLLAKYPNDNDNMEKAQAEVDAIKAMVDIVRTSTDGELIASTYEDIVDACKEAYTTCMPSFAEETRAIWHIINEKTPEAVDASMAKYAETGFNVLLLEVFAHGYVIYPDSEYCRIMPDTDNGFDVLQAFIDAGKKYDIQIHATVVNFFVGEPSYKYADNTSGSPITDEHPEWALTTKDGTPYSTVETGFIYINPARPEVREFLLNLYTEIMTRYEVDGINLDYIRYAAHDSLNNAMGFDDYTKAAFLEDTGIDLMTITDMGGEDWTTFMAWRAKQITTFVESLRTRIDEVNVDRANTVRLSACVVGEADVAVRVKSQDWALWLANDWLDFICPMAYYEYGPVVYDEILRMCSTYPNSVNVTGLAPMGMGLSTYTANKEIMASREAGAMGIALFYGGTLNPKYRDVLKNGAFRTKATPAFENQARW